MKKSTLILVVVAVIVGALTWYFEFKRPSKPETSAEILKPAFSIHSSDITSLELTRQGQTIKFERRGETWQITQPVDTRADRGELNRIADGLANDVVERKFTPDGGKLTTYGLDDPAVDVVFQLKNGSKHEVKLGTKDFNGADVFALVDGNKDVYLFSVSLLTNTDKDLSALRDNGVLDIATPDVQEFELKNENGDFVVARAGNNWKLQKPSSMYADAANALQLLAQVSSTRMTSIAAEKPINLEKYGLKNPAITFTARDKKGQTQTLLIGKKTGDEYFAQDTSRPLVFQISEDLVKKLDVGLADLRSKNLLHVEEDDITKIEVRNANQTLDVAHQGDKWIIQQPSALAGKEGMAWKFLTPFENAQAAEVMDKPPANVRAMLAKPAIQATLTLKTGQPIHISISEPDGNFVYARSDADSAVYELPKQTYDDLNFQAKDVVFKEGK